MLRYLPRLNFSFQTRNFSTSNINVTVIKSNNDDPKYNYAHDEYHFNKFDTDAKLLIYHNKPHISIGRHVSNELVYSRIKNLCTSEPMDFDAVRRMTGGCIKMFKKSTMTFSFIHSPTEYTNMMNNELKLAVLAMSNQSTNRSHQLPTKRLDQYTIDIRNEFTYDNFHDKLVIALSSLTRHVKNDLPIFLTDEDMSKLYQRYRGNVDYGKYDKQYKIRFSTRYSKHYMDIALDVHDNEIYDAQIFTNYPDANVISRAEKKLVGIPFKNNVIYSTLSDLKFLDDGGLMDCLLSRLFRQLDS